MKLVILTGLSGSGKSTALKTMEDLNFYTMDNIPFRFAYSILEELKKDEKRENIALGLDVRTVINRDDFDEFFTGLKKLGIEYKIIFLEASEQIIINRYNLTRRRHPLMKETLLKSLRDEELMMANIRAKSNLIIDTTSLSAKDLAKKLELIVSSFTNTNILNVHIQSFGFKYGIPKDADMVFDARTLPNPYYIEELREKTGLDDEVYNYVMSFENSLELYKKIYDLVKYLIPGYIRDEKRHLTIAIGCSGGKHRSVSLVRKLENDLSKIENIKVYSYHREKELAHW